MPNTPIRILDCSIRDGGLMNDSRFSDAMVREVFRAVDSAGIEIVELGYKNSRNVFSPSRYGPWRFCTEDDIARTTENLDFSARIAVMQDAHKSRADDVISRSQSPIDIIRIATYLKDIERAITLANSSTAKGYEATINIMAISHCGADELSRALDQIEAETDITACYIVDSFGALYPEDVRQLVSLFKASLKTKQVGIHCHNNLKLAFANSLAAIDAGATHVDTTLYGIGRAAGNCPTELLLNYLRDERYNIRPLLDVIGRQIMPLTREIEWGYRIPYLVTGINDTHPLEAIGLLELDDDDPGKYDYAAFLERMS